MKHKKSSKWWNWSFSIFSSGVQICILRHFFFHLPFIDFKSRTFLPALCLSFTSCYRTQFENEKLAMAFLGLQKEETASLYKRPNTLYWILAGNLINCLAERKWKTFGILKVHIKGICIKVSWTGRRKRNFLIMQEYGFSTERKEPMWMHVPQLGKLNF